MSGETIRLAQFASRLRFEGLPAPAIQRAKDSIADTIATIVFGRSLPWSAMIVAYARRMGDGGRSHILGDGERPVVATCATLANSALAHALQLNGALRPNTGAHPASTILTAALATGQLRGLIGRVVVYDH